jgi:ankyrin repeat protein
MKRYNKFISESVKDLMTPKSPQEIEQVRRKLFDKTHMGWYEEYVNIKPLIDEAYEYLKSHEFRTGEPEIFDYNTGKYGFKFNNNFENHGLSGFDGLRSFKSFTLIYEFVPKKFMLSTYAYNKDKELDIISYDEITPWYNKKTKKLSLISKLKSRLNELTKLDVYKRVLESVKDLMTPKSKEEIKKIMSSKGRKEKHKILGDRLRKACANHWLTEVEELLKLGADPNYNLEESDGMEYSSSWDPLRYAIMFRNIDCMKLLLNYGAKVKDYHFEEVTDVSPIITTQSDFLKEIEQKDEMMKLLNKYTIKGKLKKLIGMYESVKDLMTPKSEEELKKSIKKLSPIEKLRLGIENDLLWAVEEATKDGGRNILHRVLEIDPSEDSFESPLVYAIEMGRTEIAEYLINSDYYTKSDNNKALKAAIRMKNMKIVNKLLEVNKDYPLYLETALLSSVNRVNVDLVKKFIDLGADIHYKNEAALVNAIGRQNDDIIRLLLSKGANLEKAIPQCTPIGQMYGKKFRKEGLSHKLMNFKNFNTNEGVKDLMTPKSKEDIKDRLSDLSSTNKLISITNLGISDLYSKEEFVALVKDSMKEFNKKKAEATKRMEELADEFGTKVEIYDVNKEFQVEVAYTPAERYYIKIIPFVDKFEVGYNREDKSSEIWDDSQMEDSVDDCIKQIYGWISHFSESSEIMDESVKDMMTPKSKEEVWRIFKEITDKINTPLTMYPMKIWDEIDEICKLFGEERKDLYLVEEGDNNYHLIEQIFESMIVEKDQNMMKKIKAREGEWSCYPAVKLAYFNPDDMQEPSGWIFSKNFFKKELLTEGLLRSKMTPKSEDEIINTIIDRYPKPSEDCEYMVITKYWDEGKMYWTRLNHEPVSLEEAMKVKKKYEKEVRETIDILKWDEFIKMVRDNIKNNLKMEESINVKDMMTPKPEKEGLEEFMKKDRQEMADTLYAECIDMFSPNSPDDETPTVTDSFCDFLKKEVGFDIWKEFLPKYKKFINYDMVLEDLTREQLIKIFKFIYDKKLNEGVKDMMIPKSKQEMEDVFEDIIKNIRPISSDKSVVVSWGVKGILDYMGETTDTMCMVVKDDKYYSALNSFFDSLVEGKKRELINEWLYWKELKLAYNNDHYGTWLFSNDIDYSNFNINEGVRDQMTPKSSEEIKNKILEKPEVYLKRYKEFLSKDEIYDVVNKMNKREKIKAILFDVPELYSDEEKRESIDGLSKKVKCEFVLGRFSDLYNEEEQEECWKDLVINTFENTYNNGSTSVNLDWLGSKWTTYSKPFETTTNHYEYKGKKMKIHSFESGGWYEHKLITI